MKFGIIVFPGSNCDHDCYHVVKHVLGQEAEFIWHKDRDLKGVQCIILPGGFSYGDYLRPGTIARFSPVIEEIAGFANRGGLVLGICNGFQILVETGFLPGALIRNSSLRFICDTVYIKVDSNKPRFVSDYKRGDILRMPIAHNDGNYFLDNETLKEIEDQDRIVFRYSGPAGEVTDEFNPNGAVGNIAGVCNKAGNVLGMMPHPERCSEAILGGEDGRAVFESIVNCLG
ncbi:MAG: phosphoribosylformylglycinamidine synthase subunit PurQ [Thermodesulfobacteriota bacterium]